MAFATPKFPNSSKIHLFSFDPSCISFERVADVDDDDNHIDDNHIDDNHIDDMMMMTFLTGPSLFSTEMKKMPMSQLEPLFQYCMRERLVGLLAFFSFWY